MAQLSRAVVVLTKDLSLTPRTHVVVYNSPQFEVTPVPGDLMPSSDFLGHQVHTWCMNRQASKTLIHSKVKYK